jgi:hypothetical protein
LTTLLPPPTSLPAQRAIIRLCRPTAKKEKKERKEKKEKKKKKKGNIQVKIKT